MKEEDPIDLLKKVGKVDTPEFLFTRIQAKINSPAQEQLPVSWKWAGSLAFGLLLAANLFFAQNRRPMLPDTAELLVSSMSLDHSNQLYHE
ncbi:MAG TPA: hypothetical protein PLO67_16325 [Saprospiraceae bacterium]|nr:hypothetical protein [Saprospiraceae bacterium]HPI05449.1 hypothetical protein [Saprospiraceae bacterium]